MDKTQHPLRLVLLGPADQSPDFASRMGDGQSGQAGHFMPPFLRTQAIA